MRAFTSVCSACVFMGFDYEYMCVLVGGSCDGTFAPIYAHNILAATLFVRFIHAMLAPHSTFTVMPCRVEVGDAETSICVIYC